MYINKELQNFVGYDWIKDKNRDQLGRRLFRRYNIMCEAFSSNTKFPNEPEP